MSRVPVFSFLPAVFSRAPEICPVSIEPDDPLILRMFVDKRVVEEYCNGKHCVAMRVYPGREDSIGVPLRARVRTLC